MSKSINRSQFFVVGAKYFFLFFSSKPISKPVLYKSGNVFESAKSDFGYYDFFQSKSTSRKNVNATKNLTFKCSNEMTGLITALKNKSEA